MKSLFIITWVSSFLIISGCGSSSAGANKEFHDSNEQYLDTTISGWHVKVNEKLIANYRTVAFQTLDYLASELNVLTHTIPPEAINFLKDIPIWLEQSTKSNQPVQYHHDAGWLRKNGYDPRKEGGIELTALELLNRKGKDTLVLLPVFAFAYVYRVLGVHNKTMQDAYENAKLSNLYTIQDYTSKDDKRFRMRNAENYFAVLSQAYFGSLYDTPHTKNELASYDPKGYAMIEELWKIKK